MRIRGRRECLDCGEHWSYFEVDCIECPTCGSVRSSAIDDRPVRHTVRTAELDLTEARDAVDSRPFQEVAAMAAEAARSFLAHRGFIVAGELQPLDDVTLAAAELWAVADQLRRSMTTDEAAERYLLALLRGAPTGDRPDDVPPALQAARGLGTATAIERYRSDLSRYLDDHPDPEARRLLGTLRDHLRRVEALDGDVPIGIADKLVTITREIGESLRGDETALARAADHLSRL